MTKDLRNNHNRFAFTLAEVLITLAVIGVVAAITIPVLQKNIEEAQLKTAFKKSYANLTNALNQITYENGGVPYGCYYPKSHTYFTTEAACVSFYDELKKKLSIIREYKGPVDGVNIPNYIPTDSPDFVGVSSGSCAGLKTTYLGNKTVWTLADGSMLISYGSLFNEKLLILDVNGIKKPNKWGYDLFSLVFVNSHTSGYKVVIEDTVCTTYQTGGKRINDILTGK